jgi:hypothetical protein
MFIIMNLIKVGQAQFLNMAKSISFSDDNKEIKTYMRIASKNTETKDVIYSCGPCGSGKSY